MDFENTDIAGDTSTQAALEVGGSFASDLFEGDTDFIAVTIEAGQTVQFSQTDFDIPTGQRLVTLVDADGNFVAAGAPSFRINRISNDDFTFQAEQTGTFFLSVSSIANITNPAGGFGEGSYAITATEIADDFSNFASGAERLITADGSPLNGNLEYFGDVDAFTVSLAQGDTLNLTADTDVISTVTLLDADGRLVASELDLENGFTTEQSGNFTVLIESDFDVNQDFRLGADNIVTTGEYSLQTTIEPASQSPEGIDVRGTDGDDVFQGTPQDDIILGRGGNDFIDGGAGNDTLQGDDGNDTILGGGGSDLISAGTGNDYIVGGDGADTFIFPERAGHDVIADFEVGVDTILFPGIFAGLPTTLNTVLDARNNLFQQGDDVLIALTADQSVRVLNTTVEELLSDIPDINDPANPRPTSGGDGLIGTDGADELFGLAGDDSLKGLGGNDVLNGGEGSDVLFGDEGFDVLIGEGGDDLIFGGEDGDRLEGGAGDDELFGGDGGLFENDGDDRLFGGEGNDILDGGNGNDVLTGGSGEDEFIFSPDEGHDVIADFEIGTDSILFTGSDSLDRFDNRTDTPEDSFADIEDRLIQDGDDTVIAISEDQSIRLLNTQVDDLLSDAPIMDPTTILGTDGEDSISGNNGADRIFTFAGNDNLQGLGGNDVLNGGAGNDVLSGGYDNDVLIGETGADVFIFRADESGFNRIADFETGSDVVDLTDHDFGNFRDLNLVENNDTVFLYINENQSIEFTGIEDVSEFSASDFLI